MLHKTAQDFGAWLVVAMALLVVLFAGPKALD